MAHIYIDGVHIEAEQGKTVIEAAYENGIPITHFCWHPELSVAGNCRMCLVEVGMPKKLPDGSFEKDDGGNTIINYIPKLQIACATKITDGMNVLTNSGKATQAQEAVMEFLLINHPLDCPICDEAGQCKLQEYAFKHSRAESRFEEAKQRAQKRVQWGPNVMFDGERCIQCSRCIRFAKEIANQDVLTFVQRGDHVTIELFEDTQFDNPYSMNVIDICPVGALTSTDFRFKARVWEMTFNDSICPGDGSGTNIKIGVRNNQILRIEPRTNMYVNKYWCRDEVRLDNYKWVNENRVTEPMIKRDGKHEKVNWGELYSYTAEELKKFKPEEILVLGSGKATNEDNYVLRRFADEVLKTDNIGYLEQIDESYEDDFLGTKYRTPNSNGVIEMGIKPESPENLIGKLSNGEFKAVYILEEDFKYHKNIIEQLDKAEFLAVHAYNHSELTEKADVIAAASTYAEIEGTYTNIHNRVQHFEPALVTRENVRRMGMKLSRLDRFGAPNDRWTHQEMRNCRQSWRSIQGIAKNMGAEWDYGRSAQVFEDIEKNVESFKHMDYDKLEEYQGLVLGKGDQPDPKLINYESHYYTPELANKPLKTRTPEKS